MAEVNLTVSADIQGIKTKLEELTKSVAEVQSKMGTSMKNAAETSEKAMVEASNTITSTMVNNATKVLSAEEKRMSLIEKEMADLAKLKTARDKATSIEQIRAYDKAIKGTQTTIDSLGKGMQKFRDISVMSLGEMRKYMKELRNVSLVGMTPEQIAKLNTHMAKLKDAMADYALTLKTTGDRTQMIIGAMQGFVGIAQGVTGTLSLMGIENKNLEKSMMALINLSQMMSTFHQLEESGILAKMRATIKDTAAKYLNITATRAQEISQRAATASTQAGAVGFKVMGAAMKALPITLLITGVAALVGGIAYLTGAFDSDTDAMGRNVRAMKAVQSAMDEGEASTMETQVRLRSLLSVVNDHTKSEHDRKFALNEMNKIMGTTLSLTEDITAATNKYINTLVVQAQTDALIKKMAETNNELLEVRRKIVDTNDVAKLGILNAKQDDLISQYVTMEKELKKISDANITNQIAQAGHAANIARVTGAMKGGTDAMSKHTDAIVKQTKSLIDYKNVLKSMTGTGKSVGDLIGLDELEPIDPNMYKKQVESIDEFRQFLLDELDQRFFETPDSEFIPSFDDKMGAALNRMLSSLGIKNISPGQFEKIKEIGGMIVSELSDSFKEGMDGQIEAIDEYIKAREQKIVEIQSLLDAEVQQNKEGFASDIQLYQDKLEQEQALRDKAAAERERIEKKQQAINEASQLSNIFTSVTELVAANTKWGLPGILLASAAITAMYTLLANAKSQAAATVKFEKGGKGIFSGPSHSQGGIKIGDNMEAQGGEAYYILNKSATNSKGRALMDALFDAVNGGRVNFDAPMSLSDGPMSVELKEQKEIREILGHMKSQRSTVYGNGYRIETFGNVRRKIKNS